MPRDADPIERAADLAIKEMVRRLEDDPKAVPDHVLGKFVTDLNRITDRRDRQDGDEGEESKPFRLLDELPTLPRDRAKELVREELNRIEDSYQEYTLALKQLQEEEEDGEEAGSVPSS